MFLRDVIGLKDRGRCYMIRLDLRWRWVFLCAVIGRRDGGRFFVSSEESTIGTFFSRNGIVYI